MMTLADAVETKLTENVVSVADSNKCMLNNAVV